MGRKQQLKARALARARDGSLPPAAAAAHRDNGAAKTEGPGPRALSFEPDSTPKDPYDPRRGTSADMVPTNIFGNRTGRKRAATSEDRTDVITEDGEASQEPAQKRARTSKHTSDGKQEQTSTSTSTSFGTGTSGSSRDRMMSEPASWLNTPEPQERKPGAATRDNPNHAQQRFPNSNRNPGLQRSTSELKPLLQHAPSREAAEAAVTAAAAAHAATVPVAASVTAVTNGTGPSVTSPATFSNLSRPSSNFSKHWKRGRGKMRPVTIGATLYTPIAEAVAQADTSQKTKMLNFIGVIVSFRLPTKSTYGSGDYTMNLNIVDPGCFTADDRLSLNLFGRTKDALPGHATEGMVILLRNVKMSLFNGKIVGTIFKDKMAWCTLSKDTGLPAAIRTNTGMTVHQPEREYMQDMSYWYRETYISAPTADSNPPSRVGSMTTTSGSGAAGPSTGEGTGQAFTAVAAAVTHNLKRTITLDQLKDDMFCHCVAEVVRVFAQTDRPEIYVTDWTSHPELTALNNKDIGWAQEDLDRLEEQRGDSGGGSVLKVTLWDEQANAAMSLQKGSFIHLRNMRCKRTPLGMFEGTIGGTKTLRESKENKWQVQKLKRSDPLLEALLERKAKALEDLELERAMSWPEPGSSAEKARDQVATPPAGASGNAQPHESVSVSATTHSESSAKKEDLDDPAKALPGAHPITTVESSTEAPQENEVVVAASAPRTKESREQSERMPIDPRDQTTQDGDQEADVEMQDADPSPEERLRSLTQRAAQMRASMAAASQTSSQSQGQSQQRHQRQRSVLLERNENGAELMASALNSGVVVRSQSEPGNRDVLQVDKSQHREQASQPSTILSIPLSDTTNSTSSGTPSLLYSLPPPGQQVTAVRQVPSSSHPSTHSQHLDAVQMAVPLSSTPMLNLRLNEDDSGPSQLQHPGAALKSASDSMREARRRANQERADEMLRCNFQRWKLFSMKKISDGQGLGAKHHVRGRIVDVMPRQICEWVKVKCSLCKQELPETDNFCAPCADEEGTHLNYVWQFAVYLHDEGEAESASVPVVISDEYAEAFLPGMDPAKHRRDVKAQRRLRARLEPIFGDVIEDPDLWRGPYDPATAADVELSQSEIDTSTNPILDLAVYAFKVSYQPMPKPKQKKKKEKQGSSSRSPSGPQQGDIRCKLFDTVLALKR